MVASILIYFLLFTLLAVNLQFTLSEENGDDIKALIADMSLETIMKELKDREIECVACVSREDYAERLEMVAAGSEEARLDIVVLAGKFVSAIRPCARCSSARASASTRRLSTTKGTTTYPS